MVPFYYGWLYPIKGWSPRLSAKLIYKWLRFQFFGKNVPNFLLIEIAINLLISVQFINKIAEWTMKQNMQFLARQKNKNSYFYTLLCHLSAWHLLKILKYLIIKPTFVYLCLLIYFNCITGILSIKSNVWVILNYICRFGWDTNQICCFYSLFSSFTKLDMSF